MGKSRPEWVQKIFDAEEAFWKEYPSKTQEEKINFWASSLFKSMREQEESGGGIYSMYTLNWLKKTLEREPDFIKILPSIYNIWGGMFDAGKVDRIVKNLVKKIMNNNTD